MAKKSKKGRRRLRGAAKFTIKGLDELIVFKNQNGDLDSAPNFVFSNPGGVIRVVNTTDAPIRWSSDAIKGGFVDVPARSERPAKIKDNAERRIYATNLSKRLLGRGGKKKKRAARRLRAGSDPDIIIT